MRLNIQKSIRKIRFNVPLIIGTIIVVILILMSLYPEYFSPADPYGVQRLQYNSAGTESTVITPPIAPNKDYPWGTDERGRDMKSLIVYGTKVTILVATVSALLRLLIALPLAVLAAYRNRVAIWLIRQFKVMFSALPLLIAIVILSKIALFAELIKNPAIQSSMWVVLLGWSPLAHSLKQRISEVLQEDFIEGEIAIGKNKWEIALQNILPHIIPSIIVYLFLEIAIILLLMVQVGVLGVTFGGGYYNAEGGLAVPNEFDWASLLQLAYMLFGTDKMWMVLYPTAAFAFSVIGFNLLGEGLRIEFEKRDSRVITYLRKVPSFFSPKSLVFEFQNYPLYKSTIWRKLTVYALIIVIAFFPVLPSKYKMDADNAMAVIKELTQEKYEGRHTGTAGMKKASEYIAEKLRESGVQPMGENYIHPFDVTTTYNIKGASFKVKTQDNKELSFDFRKDFHVFTPFGFKESLEILPVTPKQLETLDNNTILKFREKLLLLDTRNLNDRVITGALMRLSYVIKPKCVLLLQRRTTAEEPVKYSFVDKAFENITVISASTEMADQLLRTGAVSAEIEVKVDQYVGVKGYNVVGVVPGTNPDLKDECIVIGCSLDSIGDDIERRYPAALEAGGAAVNLEVARSFVKNGIRPEKTLVFAFWDGTYTDYRGSAKFLSSTLNKQYSSMYYIDLRFFAPKGSRSLMLDSTKSIPKSKTSQMYIRRFKESGRGKNVPIQYVRFNSLVLQDFLGIGKEALLFSSSGVEDTLHTPADTYENISKEQLLKQGQVVLDTIIKISKLKL